MRDKAADHLATATIAAWWLAGGAILIVPTALCLSAAGFSLLDVSPAAPLLRLARLSVGAGCFAVLIAAALTGLVYLLEGPGPEPRRR